MHRILDLLRPVWLTGYDGGAFGRDVMTGVVLSVLLVPQAMAYATLAGLSPSAGLLTAMVAPFLYALIGQVAAVSMGPVALASLLVADAIAMQDVEPATAAAIVAVEAGAMLALLGVLRLGRLVNFVSEPALLGFTAAAAFLIAASQLASLAGIDADRAGTIQGALFALWAAGSPHLPTLLLGLLALAGFLFGEAGLRRLALLLRQTGTARLAILKSNQLLVIIAVAVLASLFLPDVATVARPEAGFPVPALPAAAPSVWIALLLPSLTVAVVVFVTGIAVAKSLSSRRRQSLDSSREAIAIGAANLAVGVTGGYAAGVSLSRSALVYDVGGRSPLASAVAALIVLPITLFGAALLARLPETALAALVMSAVVGLVRLREIREVVRFSRMEALVIAVTFVATLALGVQWGLLAGAASGVMAFLWSSSQPRVTREGVDRTAGSDIYRSVGRDGVDADTGSVVVVRIDRPLYFGNVGHAEEQVGQIVADHPDAKCLILDMRAVTEVDATGLRMLTRMLDTMEEQKLEIVFASLQRPMQEALANQKHVARCDHFDTVAAAMSACDTRIAEMAES